VYYEHCSYFGASSLESLFTRTGFEVVECFLDFDDQYLVLEARPVASVSTAPPRRQWIADHQHVRELMREFAPAVDRRVRTWRSDLDEACRRGERVVIWGAGSKGVSYLTALGLRDEIDCAVDINPHKAGKFMAGTGHEIVIPEALVGREPDVVVVMNPIYRDEISRRLDELGLHPKLVTV